MTGRARTILRGAVLAFVLLSGVAPDLRSQTVSLDRELLTRYTRAYLALDAAREEYHAKIARIHDDVGLARAREELDAQVARIYADNAISSEQYGEITLLISQNEEIRAVFEEMARELRGGGSPPR